MTDPIADLLTRIRNAVQARHASVIVPRSNIKLEIVKILKTEGFLEGYIDLQDEDHGKIKVFPKYDAANHGVIRGLSRVSLGVAILTTPRGVLTDRQARKDGVGGEVLCYVW